MTERSIAEIIGWERRENAERTVWYDPPEPDLRRRHEWSPITPQHTVDDLLAWLGEQGWSANIMTWASMGDVSVRLGRFYEYHHEYHAPTLLAALEAAVRAVARETQGATG